ncbi:MAG: hypothetical protein ACTHMM_12660 [Agriterribacter sp.]
MNKTLQAILKAGIVAGSLDILLAFANAWFSSGVSPMRVLQFIASAVMAKKAFQQSYRSALLGLAIHFIITLVWTGLFFAIYNHYKRVVRSAFLQSVFYGLFIWLVMNLLILPLTNVPKSGFQWTGAIKGAIILIIAIGFPLVSFARKHYQETLYNNTNRSKVK